MISSRPESGLQRGKEFVTTIPKKSNPEGLGDLRNISCTMLASKIFESFILDTLKREVGLRTNQYGYG